MPSNTQSKNTAEPKPPSHGLLGLKDVPSWAQDNPYILAEYREISNSYYSCLASLTYLHNQTVNIYSHLLFFIPVALLIIRSALVFYGEIDSLTSPRKEDLLVFSLFFAGAVACMVNSATYHTLMSHSQALAERTKQLDYTGITCLIWGSFVPTIYYTFTCEKELMRAFLYTFTGIAILLVVFFPSPLANKPWAAPLVAPIFVLFAASGVAPLGKGVLMYGWAHMEEMVGISWVLAHGVIYALGLAFFVTRWPESSHPGKFDLFGASHQLFHVAVVLAASVHFVGLLKAYEFQHSHYEVAICPKLSIWKGHLLFMD